MVKKRFLFDLDDTLMWNLHDYSQPILDFAKLVIDRVGPRAPDIPTIINLQAEIDTNRVKQWIPLGNGFSKKRFPTSMAETYKKICEPLGIVDLEGEEMSYEIGTQAFSMKRWKNQGLVPGAEAVIKYLGEKGDELILLTKGDMEVQEMKISANNLESKFDEIHIVPTKNSEVVESYIGDRDKANVWHIGNSKKSDVLPAIEAKIGIIYIPMETWKYEKEHAEVPKYDRLITLNKISQIMSVYDRL